MSAEDRPEPDRIEGAPHPRETIHLFGQEAAEAGFLDAFNSGRLHHAWLLTGPRGTGKATLAWRIARFLLATPMDTGGGLFGEAPARHDTLDIAPDHPVSHRLIARSEPGLHLLRRGGAGSAENESLRQKNFEEGKFSQEIRIPEVRGLTQFLHLSSTEGGRRIVIVDAADELNTQAANALLKILEEPPRATTFLLVSHQPSRLLPTIRSRCRELRCKSLTPDGIQNALVQIDSSLTVTPALAALSAGSVGEAMRLMRLGGLEMYAEIVAIYSGDRGPDRPRALKLAEAAATRGAEARFDLLLTMFDTFLARLARTGATGQPPVPEAAPGESDLLQRLAPNPHKARAWAEIAQTISERTRHGQAVNLDPAALVLDTVFKITETASR